MGKINSRNKGKVGERELAKIFRSYGFTEARRGQQYCGIDGDDVVGLPGFHVECKRVERLNIENAMEQSIRDSKDDEIPAVFHRRDRKKWLVTIGIDDFMGLITKGEL